MSTRRCTNGCWRWFACPVIQIERETEVPVGDETDLVRRCLKGGDGCEHTLQVMEGPHPIGAY